jgi:leader peptidase (prepilin peptidase) / N-methyltransferase
MRLALLAVVCGLFGLAIGSFLNVVIYRVPKDLSVVTPRSACPDCGTQLAGRDNVPVLSWLVLRGRCRTCGRPISARYPLVELATALLFAAGALRLGFSPALPAYLVLLGGLFALACIDLEVRLLPRKIVWPLLGMVALLLLVASIDRGSYRALGIAVACSAAWWAVFFLINRTNEQYLGMGDVRLALVLGLGLGWLGVPNAVIGFFAANVLGAVVGLTLIATRRISRDSPIPYGLFLAAGAAIGIFLGPNLHVRGL